MLSCPPLENSENRLSPESPGNEIIKLRELPGGEEDGRGGEAELEIRAGRLPQLVCSASQTTCQSDWNFTTRRTVGLVVSTLAYQ